MLHARGYVVTEHPDDPSILIDGTKIAALTTPISKLNTDRVKELVGTMNSLKTKHAIAVYDSITPQARSMTKNPGDLRIEIFHSSQLGFNITKSNLVPKHERMSPAEASDFKKRYTSKWGTLTYSDPISRFYNFSRGDVIKITRRNGIIAYRIVR